MSAAKLKQIAKIAAAKGKHFDADSLLQHIQDMENDRLELAHALRLLVGAHNCNYTLKTMRSEGLFKHADTLLDQLGLGDGPEFEVKGVAQGPELAHWIDHPMARAKPVIPGNERVCT